MGLPTTPGQQAPYNTSQGQKPVYKAPPAPGASPKGGTTSLPQALQSILTPNPAKAQPQGGGWGSMPGSSGATGPTPASQPPGTVPSAPPAAPPAGTGPGVPPAPQVDASHPAGPGATVPGQSGAPGENAAMHDALYQQLMERIKNPSSYDSAAVSAERQQGTQHLQDERKLSEDRAKAEAAGRGMYNSTGLNTSLGDIGTQYNKGLGEMEAKITEDKAQRHNQDMNDAMNAIFTYGNAQLLSQQQQNDLWLAILNAGYAGGPGMPGASTQLPLPGQG